MTNDALEAHWPSAEPFDQDSDATVPERVHTGTCEACRVGNCGECSFPDCTCPHPFAVVGRAIVELNGSISRTSQLLGELGGGSRAEPSPPIRADEPSQATLFPASAPKARRRGLGRRKLPS
jgi:hypothetical protein